MPNFDKIKIDGTSYMAHDTETATALSAETQARQQAIQQLKNELKGVPDDILNYIHYIISTAPVAPINGSPSLMIMKGNYFIGNNGRLYLATANIPPTGTVTPNTNCKQTWIGTILTNLEESIENVTNVVDQQLEPLETRVTNIEANINSLNVYNFDTCVFIGDSYLNQNPSWGDQLASILPGCRAHYNYPSGGGGFQTAGANGSFLDMVSSGGQVYKAVQSFKNNVTFVLIEGGINDGDQESGQESLAVANTLNAAKALFPNAKMAVVYNWAPRAYPNTIWHGIARGCADTGVPFCPNSYLWLWNNSTSYWFQSDQIHPSTVGTNMAVRLLYMWLMNGKVAWPFTPQVTKLSNGMSLIWYIDSADQVCIGIYGTSTSNTAALGTAPFCLRPYQQQIFFPWLNVTNLAGTESPYVRIDPNDGAMATNATFSSQTNVSQWNTSIPARQFGFMGFTQ